MIKKTKIFFSSLILAIGLCVALPISGYASPVPSDNGPTSGSGVKTADPCSGYTGAKQAECTNCQKNGACLTCHPEYNFGQALTPDQYKSCTNCNKVNNLGNCLKQNVIVKDLNTVVNVLSGLVLIVVVGVLMAGGIQYSMAGKPEAATQARKRIINGLVALVSFFFIWAFLQWLIPGGI